MMVSRHVDVHVLGVRRSLVKFSSGRVSWRRPIFRWTGLCSPCCRGACGSCATSWSSLFCFFGCSLSECGCGGKGWNGWLTEYERGVGQLEAREVPKVRGLAELVASRAERVVSGTSDQ
jgi:hypothetical protein